MYSLKIFIIFLFSLLTGNSCLATDLKIHIVGIKNSLGNIHIALFNNPNNFPSESTIYKKSEVKIQDNQSIHTFYQLSPGSYALAVYHDENDNDRFDLNFLGLPQERYGFSNNASAFLSPPSFDAAKIKLEHKDLEIKIDLSK